MTKSGKFKDHKCILPKNNYASTSAQSPPSSRVRLFAIHPFLVTKFYQNNYII